MNNESTELVFQECVHDYGGPVCVAVDRVTEIRCLKCGAAITITPTRLPGGVEIETPAGEIILEGEPWNEDPPIDGILFSHGIDRHGRDHIIDHKTL